MHTPLFLLQVVGGSGVPPGHCMLANPGVAPYMHDGCMHANPGVTPCMHDGCMHANPLHPSAACVMQVIIPKAEHACYIDQPEAFHHYLTTFVDKVFEPEKKEL